uniref:WH2 domain-containing protein n=1 Tax=Ditylenchus dipsaci TaxID=166011 RepID=A0A915E5Q6_9BILA
MQKKDYKYVFDKKPKYMEALALKPVHCHAVDFEKQMDHNLCYEVDDQLELYEKMDNQCKPVKASTSTDFSESLLIHCEFNRSDRSSDPFSYKPEVDDLNAFDFPDVLPNLPGTSSSKNIAFNDAFFQSIAPSSAYFNLAQQPNSDIDLSARNSFYQLEESLQSQPVQSKPPVSISSVRSLAAPLAMSSPPAPPPPPPPPPPPSLLLAQPANGVSKPVVLESTKGRSDLMESIRAAGGLKKLKKVDKSPASSESGSSYKQHSKVPSNAESGDDLMSSLAKALEMRRKGISGKNNKEDKFSHLEKSSKTSDGAKGNEPLSRLRQLIPPPSAQKILAVALPLAIPVGLEISDVKRVRRGGNELFAQFYNRSQGCQPCWKACGLPFPRNLEVAKSLENIMRHKGVTPATIALYEGKICVGLDGKQLEFIAQPINQPIKASRRDIPNVLAEVGLIKKFFLRCGDDLAAENSTAENLAAEYLAA